MDKRIAIAWTVLLAGFIFNIARVAMFNQRAAYPVPVVVFSFYSFDFFRNLLLLAEHGGMV